MSRRVLILSTLLIILTVSCDKASLDSDMLSNEDINVSFYAEQPGYEFDVDIAYTRAADNAYEIGVIGFPVYEKDSLSNALIGANLASCSTGLCNAEFAGVIPGYITPIDANVGINFPRYNNSALEVYSYIPYVPDEDLLFKDSTCYLSVNLYDDCFSTDYLYSGRVFKTRADYTSNGKFSLQYKHAFAKLNLNVTVNKAIFNILQYVKIEALEVYFNKSGVGYINLQDGTFISDDSSPSYINTPLNVVDEELLINKEKLTITIPLYIPASMRITKINVRGRLSIANLPLLLPLEVSEDDLNFEQGKVYNVDIIYTPNI